MYINHNAYITLLMSKVLKSLTIVQNNREGYDSYEVDITSNLFRHLDQVLAILYHLLLDCESVLQFQLMCGYLVPNGFVFVHLKCA